MKLQLLESDVDYAVQSQDSDGRWTTVASYATLDEARKGERTFRESWGDREYRTVLTICTKEVVE